MSRQRTKRTTWIGWILSAILIAGSVLLWTERQMVVDAIQYQQFTPTDETKQVAEEAGLTDDAIFTFYASHPSIESSEEFNRHCERRQANSPILGCYAANRIYIFNVTDERLAGMKTVTAAHELLHAEYQRLSDSEKRRLQSLLETEYKKGTNAELEARMDYYEETQPGQAYNELHSIIGTEFATISTELESYYARFFKDRGALVELHQQVDSRFKSLSEEADTLVSQIEKLAITINANTKTYNEQIESLNVAVGEFNTRASSSGGFTTQAEFQAARQELITQSATLAQLRQTIQSDINEYKTLLAKLDTINSESASLNQSLDSTLSDAPKI